MKPIEVSMPAGIMKVGDKTYAVAGDWIEIPNGTTLTTLHNYVVFKRPVPPRTNEYKAEGSKGATYIIKHNVEKDVWSCSCPASKYRRMVCKHIKKIQNATR